ncbi:hypothetical protein L9W92_12555 [Pelotomaculum terephthalicicum JT]|uniref:hypothetical protein n=1 Tax=Pelotomaculum TaxID=191373 RepID=UPI0009C4A1A6|nr:MULTISPECIES: hypothetical protein [Pelotomaculum]MCG9968869.1 hypothetical protein [Pelotomaculum terephthalicicum JT]OPX85070.1 MAG: hypothetical protein A4E54_02620 [Pelotomaculum sp. PtaB.Bin117]
MTYEVYKPKTEQDLTISISKNHLTLNKKLASKLNMSHVELAYDQLTKTIRIKPTVNDKGLTVNKNKIGARGFLKHFKIQCKGKYCTTFDENENALYIRL